MVYGKHGMMARKVGEKQRRFTGARFCRFPDVSPFAVTNNCRGSFRINAEVYRANDCFGSKGEIAG
jgi:hypothetical protein